MVYVGQVVDIKCVVPKYIFATADSAVEPHMNLSQYFITLFGAKCRVLMYWNNYFGEVHINRNKNVPKH